MRTTLFTAALSLMLAIPAAAQGVAKVSFQPGGRVSVEASSATVRSILNEWAKNGGTKVLGAEKVSGAPVTLKLVNVPEAQALEIILRNAAGYMAAPSRIAAGPSIYDRIMIMATTSAPPPAANRPPSPTNNNGFNGTQRFIPPRVEQKEPDEQDEPDENPPNPPVFTFPQPGQQNGGFQPGFNQPGMVNTMPQVNQPVVINPATPPTTYQPGMPVGVSQPGMMVAPPQPTPTTTQPGMIRPPGREQ